MIRDEDFTEPQKGVRGRCLPCTCQAVHSLLTHSLRKGSIISIKMFLSRFTPLDSEALWHILSRPPGGIPVCSQCALNVKIGSFYKGALPDLRG